LIWKQELWIHVTPSGIVVTKDSMLDNIRPHLACAVVRDIHFNSRSIESINGASGITSLAVWQETGEKSQ